MSREVIENLVAAERRADEGRLRVQYQLEVLAELESRNLDVEGARRTLNTLRLHQVELEKNVQRLLIALTQITA